MSTVVSLKPVGGCHVRLTTTELIGILLELESQGWDARVVAGQFIVNTHGKAIPKPLVDRIKSEKQGLIRLVQYCEAVP